MSDGIEPTATATDSFTRVLDSEKAADQRLADARAEADAILRDAMATERRIATRADARVQALHRTLADRVAQEKARMLAAFEAEKPALDAPPDADRVSRAAKRLARRLIGLDPT
ncbi:hypothetical protein VK792_15920 [Mesobacterium sp. TK19101]|uniref:Uncharacterized protein n=1 Tax=Mesobacterium hydrothermale TaxID=3111907 RepID=A0ABU6HLQ7_9RHOB|nr:hypothetical protein [Mesobacterium sp. TK19101]MEC3862780.1 hypothetical protein [Mesobacterium sp. TK19101]